MSAGHQGRTDHCHIVQIALAFKAGKKRFFFLKAKIIIKRTIYDFNRGAKGRTPRHRRGKINLPGFPPFTDLLAAFLGQLTGDHFTWNRSRAKGMVEKRGRTPLMDIRPAYCFEPFGCLFLPAHESLEGLHGFL
jgi:hypothetical protein